MVLKDTKTEDFVHLKMEAFRRAEAKKIGTLEEVYLVKEFSYKLGAYQNQVQKLLESQ